MIVNYESINQYYTSKLREHGPTAQGMDWKNEETQNLRFQVLARYMDFTARPSLLDVGCGAGELKNYLANQNLPCTYKGLDIVPEMVAAVNKRFGDGAAMLGNLLELDLKNAFDYVVASGTFNAKLNNEDEEWRMFFLQNIEKMFTACRKAVIFNGMTQFVDWRYDRLYYINIQDFSTFIVNQLSRKFTLDHSYPLYEVTFVIYK